MCNCVNNYFEEFLKKTIFCVTAGFRINCEPPGENIFCVTSRFRINCKPPGENIFCINAGFRINCKPPGEKLLLRRREKSMEGKKRVSGIEV